MENNRSIQKKLALLLFVMVCIGYFGRNIAFNPIFYIGDRFIKSLSDGGSGRVQIWRNLIVGLKDNWVFGIGINSTRYYNWEIHSVYKYAHNTFIEILFEGGIVGLGLYLLFCYYTIKCSYQLYKRDKKTLYILLTIVAMLTQMMSLSLLYNEAFYFILIILYKYNSYNDLSKKKCK